MGAVNGKPSSHRSDAVSAPNFVGSKQQRAIEKRQKKSARNILRAIRLCRKRSNKIVPLSGPGSYPDSDTFLEAAKNLRKVFCKDDPSILPFPDVSQNELPKDDSLAASISDQDETAQALEDRLTSTEYGNDSDDDDASEKSAQSDASESDLEGSLSPDDDENDTQEAILVDHALNMSLSVEQPNTPELEILPDDCDWDELTLLRMERYKIRIDSNLEKSAEFDYRLKRLENTQSERSSQLRIYENFLLRARRPPRDYRREEKLNRATKKLMSKYTQDAVEQYRMSSERAVTEAKIDLFMMKLKPAVKYTDIYKDRESYYLRPIAEESESELELAVSQ